MRDDLAGRLRSTFVQELEDQLREGEALLAALASAPGDAERLRALFRVVHTLKGAARAAGATVVERRCHAVEALLADARDRVRTLDASALAQVGEACDALRVALDALRAGRAVDDPALDVAPSPRAMRAITPTDAAAIAADARDAEPAVARGDDGATVRIAAARLDDLLGAVARLLVVTARATGHAQALAEAGDRVPAAGPRAALATHADEAGAIARELERLAAEIGGGVRELRLRPVADAVEHLPALVRDVARATGKEVRLLLDGTALTADRAVLEHVREALLHLVRNAVDHGLESPEARRAAGKPATGTVHVGARLEGDRLVLTVADDGRGLDVAALRARLAALGEPVPADDRAVARRVFEGGISTRAGDASAISGRGVGLDAAREAMRRARGGLDVAWIAGQGTTFTLDAPLTLVTLRALVVALGDQAVALPTAYVERLLRIPAAERRVLDGRPAVVAPEGPATLVPLAAVLGPPVRMRASAGDAIARACVLRVGARRLAVAVDAFLDERELVVRPIAGRGKSPLPHVSGAALLGDGRVALVLDAAAVVASGLGLDAAAASPDGDVARPAAARRARVLVVDDSITTRTLVQSVLEAAGLDVTVAVDGADAWRRLQESGASLVVSDVEMPGMDGFSLCAAIRAAPRLRELPVVLVTGLESPAERRRGLEVGADAYLGKSSFDQDTLVATVRRLLAERADAPGAGAA